MGGGAVKLAVKASKIAKATKAFQKVAQVGKAGKVVEKGITAAVESASLPNREKIRFIPRTVDTQSGKIL